MSLFLNSGNGRHKANGSSPDLIAGAITAPLDPAAVQLQNESPQRVLIIEDNESMLQLLKIGLTHAGFEVRTTQTGSEGLNLARRWHPDIILLDMMMPGIDGLQICKLLREQETTAGIPIVMLTAVTSLEQKLAAFEAGANDYIIKPCDNLELVARIHVQLRDHLHQQPGKAAHAGKVITLFSLSGGVGKSSIAINLAVGLSDKTPPIQVALIDSVLAAGEIKVMLNLPRSHGWGELAKEDRSQVTTLLLSSYFMPTHYAEVRTLAAPGHPQDAERIDTDLANLVYAFSRQHYEYTLIDTPPAFDAVTLTALDVSDLILLVLTPTVPGVASAVKALQVFRELGYRNEQVMVVNNFANSGEDIDPTMIAKTLKHRIDFTLLQEKRNYVTAINKGIPYITQYAKSPLARDFRRLAELLTSRRDVNTEPLGSINERRSLANVKTNKLALTERGT
jgi:pilus assembly protein CpaE